MTCPDCTTAAKIWHWGGFSNGCHGCFVRALARMPKVHRNDAYTAFHHEHQDMAKVRALQTKVKAEHDRMVPLRMQQQGG